MTAAERAGVVHRLREAMADLAIAWTYLEGEPEEASVQTAMDATRAATAEVANGKA